MARGSGTDGLREQALSAPPRSRGADSLPTLVWSDSLQGWLSYQAPSFSFSDYVPAVFGTAVYLYGGVVFPKGAGNELRDRLPGMMTRISLAIAVAFVYSVAVTLGWEGEPLWWELATLVTVMVLGHWMELPTWAWPSAGDRRGGGGR